jgi:hypothetical protein
MRKWLNKILFILISISFVIAVFEIDSDSRHNTFHDEDDTYIQSNNLNAELNSHFEQQKDLNQEYCDLAISFLDLILFDSKAVTISHPQGKNLLTFQKIFIRNSVWRI